MRQILRKLVLSLLERYTKQLLAAHNPKIIAITGSVGKTTTKQAIAHVLRSEYKVLAHSGNYNTEFGLPLSLFELEAPANILSPVEWLKVFRAMRKQISTPVYPYDVVVLEMGADKPGDIQRFVKYIKPDIGVVTAVAKVHLEEFRHIEAILEEKWLLAKNSKRALYNHDDPRLRKNGEKNPEARGYGLSETDYWAELEEFGGQGLWNGSFHSGEETYTAIYPAIAKQTIYSFVAALAVAEELSMEIAGALDTFSHWKQPSGRMNILRGKNDSTIIDDSYNANPFATVAAIDALGQFEGRKFAILGSMNELGDYEADGHKLVGGHCSEVDILATIGRAANKYLAPAALAVGIPKENIKECNSPYEAGEFIQSQLQPGDVVLVKGSQNGVFAEEAIKSLLADPKDIQQLVRQSESWLSRKREQFS